MLNARGLVTGVFLALLAGGLVFLVHSAAAQNPNDQPPRRPGDVIGDAQAPKAVPSERPERQKTAHDLSDIFTPGKAAPSSEALIDQPEHGGMTGFDFYRDPLGAMKPGTTFEEIYKAATANKPKVIARQRKLLENRYNLEPRLDPKATMSRGKPLVVGPTALLTQGMNWEMLAAMSPVEVRSSDVFPYKALPHPVQGGGLGGQVFPQMQTRMFPRLERYDVEHDLPEAFLPEFPPAMYLQSRPELSDVDFTEFEQRTAYFNGDEIHALKNGMNIFNRIQVSRMAQIQNMCDFPPAPKLTPLGRLDPEKATESELRGEKLFFGKAQCTVCHPAPLYLDNQMHDLRLERFLKREVGDGPIKSFTLRAIKDSPPYLHDGRCLTLEDTVEFFNLVLELKLTKDEKPDLVLKQALYF